jgi:hypothetical protein
VLVAARYDSVGRLAVAQGFERRGDVWSDLRLYNRETLVQRLRARRRVAVARAAPVPGDFESAARVHIEPRTGRMTVNGGANGGPQDDLPLPLF